MPVLHNVLAHVLPVIYETYYGSTSLILPQVSPGGKITEEPFPGPIGCSAFKFRNYINYVINCTLLTNYVTKQ